MYGLYQKKEGANLSPLVKQGRGLSRVHCWFINLNFNTAARSKTNPFGLICPSVSSSNKGSATMTSFGFRKLAQAKRGFKEANLLKEGGFGTVYKDFFQRE